MKKLIYAALVVVLAFVFNGCENKMLMMEHKIQPTKELDVAQIGNPNYFSINFIYQNYFKRIFIFRGGDIKF